MKIRIISIPVKNQEDALNFYTQKLGFIKKQDIPLGNSNRWLTLASKEDPEGPEILLEPSPNNFEPAKLYQDALYTTGIPYTQFNVGSVNDEYERLVALDIKFTMKPTHAGSAIITIFDDSCGNLIQLVELID